MTQLERQDVETPLHEQHALAPPSPQERLQKSREALQAWIAQTYHAHEAPTQGPPTPADPQEPGWLSILADSLMDVPAATIAIRWVKRWWRHHPWRATVEVVSTAGRELAKPVAVKHPWILLGGAFLAGGLLARLRPWKWVSGGTVLAGLLPRTSLTSMFHAALSLFTHSDPSPSPLDEESRVEFENQQEQMAA